MKRFLIFLLFPILLFSQTAIIRSPLPQTWINTSIDLNASSTDHTTCDTANIKFYKTAGGKWEIAKYSNIGVVEFKIDSVGNVGIGTTAPAHKLHIVGNFALGDSTTGDTDGIIYFADDGSITAESFKWDDGNDRFEITDDFAVSGNIGNDNKQSETLGVGVTTFAVTKNVVEVTGDGGGNTIATITGANVGNYSFIFVDGNVTISNDDTHGNNTVDLDAANDFTSADDKTLFLNFDGTSWYRIGESGN